MDLFRFGVQVGLAQVCGLGKVLFSVGLGIWVRPDYVNELDCVR